MLARRGREAVVAVAMVTAVALCRPSISASSLPVAEARKVTGGAGFADAPLLRPGTYVDTLLARETLFYAVRLREGQRLTVRATVDLRPGSRDSQISAAKAFGGFALRVYSPLRQALTIDHQLTTVMTNLVTDQDAWRTVRVVSPARAAVRAQLGEDWRGPGRYHVTAAVSAIFDDVGAIVELPLRLRIEVDDRARGRPGRTASGPLDSPPAPTERGVATRAPGSPKRAHEGEPSRSGRALAGAGGLVVGLLVGLLLVAGLLAFVRRRAP